MRKTKGILSSTGRRFWFFDFDGTLAPIVHDRSAAKMHPACRTMLEELIQKQGQVVAIISSRRLEDVTPRVTIPGLYVGGYNGFKWLLPRGMVWDGSRHLKDTLMRQRERLMPFLNTLSDLPGLDMEDKLWSVTLHLRRMARMTREVLSERLQYQEILAGTRIMHGPEAWEIAFHSSYNKSTGIRILCDKLALAIGRDDLIYAGDDENDALAMTAVASLGGLNIAVGNQSFYPDSFLVAGPQELAALCRELSVGSLRK